MRTASLLLLIVLTTTVAQAQDILRNIDGPVVRETPHFKIYAENSYLPVDLDWLQPEVESIYAYLVERMGVKTEERFDLVFRPPDTSPCPIRGLAHFDEGRRDAIVFADQRTTRAQLSGVLAHEIAHLLHALGLKAGTTDQNLTEGFASWAAGKYWSAWQGATADNVQNWKREGRYKPLESYYTDFATDVNAADCLKIRDTKYGSFAAFIDYLIADYGMEKFLQLLKPREAPSRTQSPQSPTLGELRLVITDPQEITRLLQSAGPIHLSPPVVPVNDFKDVYGHSLSELEKMWLEKLDARAR
jgi:hypothetical protein